MHPVPGGNQASSAIKHLAYQNARQKHDDDAEERALLNLVFNIVKRFVSGILGTMQGLIAPLPDLVKSLATLPTDFIPQTADVAFLAFRNGPGQLGQILAQFLKILLDLVVVVLGRFGLHVLPP
ncbi:MAG: hypothetical protein ACX936_11280 [Marinobacter sp.]